MDSVDREPVLHPPQLVDIETIKDELKTKSSNITQGRIVKLRC